jgi:hypothetical protein
MNFAQLTFGPTASKENETVTFQRLSMMMMMIIMTETVSKTYIL